MIDTELLFVGIVFFIAGVWSFIRPNLGGGRYGPSHKTVFREITKFAKQNSLPPYDLLQQRLNLSRLVSFIVMFFAMIMIIAAIF